MSGPMIVQTDGLRKFSQTHADIASGVSQLVSGAPTAAGVESTHGPIAMAVQSALSDLLGSRTGTLQNTATSGSTIAGLLTKAAQMYDDGDREGAAKVKAIAEAMSQESGAAAAPAAGAPAAGAIGGGGAGGGGGGALGQMMGQLGQVGQVGQQMGGAMQGLQQVPQQVMQGVQQIVEAATGAAGETGAGADDAGMGGGAAPVSSPQDPTGGVPPGLVGPVVGGVLGEGVPVDPGTQAPPAPTPPRQT